VRQFSSGRWHASYLDEASGRRVNAPTTFDTKREAALWLSAVESDKARGLLLDPYLSQRTFAEWAKEWIDGLHVKPKTRLGYESALNNHVLPAFGTRAIGTIVYRDCKRFVDDLLAKGYAPGTVGEARKILRLVLSEALKSDAIHRNPAVGLRVPRGERQEMVFLGHDEVLLLAHHITHRPIRPGGGDVRYTAHPQYGLLVRLAALTGLRAGEVGALRIGRVNVFRKTIEVAESAAEIRGELVYGPPKTYARRSVPLPRTLAVELEQHLATRPPDPVAFVFTAPEGGPLRHVGFYQRHFRPAVRRSGVDPRTRFHDLRHTAAALMIAEGAHLLAVKERLGHSSIQVTADRYGHLFPSLEAALSDRLDDSYRDALQRFSSPAIARISRERGLSTGVPGAGRGQHGPSPAQTQVPPGRFELPAYRLGGGCSIP
jgi:integrase